MNSCDSCLGLSRILVVNIPPVMVTAAKVQKTTTTEDTIETWLASWDFISNPFSTFEASREVLLDRYFVRGPFYDQLLSSFHSGIVFAPRGGGKTATRIMLETECRPAVSTGNILAVSFTDFSPFAETVMGNKSSPSLHDYLPLLLGKILPAVIHAASGALVWGGEFDISDISELRYWIDKYAAYLLSDEYLATQLDVTFPKSTMEYIIKSASTVRALTKAANIPSDISPNTIGYVTLWGQILRTKARKPYLPLTSPSQIMEAFVKFVLKLLSSDSVTCDVLFLLLDGIDEYELTHGRPEESVALLRPLLGNLRFLEIPGLAVKFFLPLDLQKTVEKVARTDRLETFTLSWTNGASPGNDFEDLLVLLRHRIWAFNKVGRQTLTEISVPSLRHWIEEAMVEEAAGSPRNLLRLGHQIFVEHCRSNPLPESMITADDWERAVNWYRTHIAFQSETEVSIENSFHSPDLSIRVDFQTGKVFKQNTEVAPPLAELEFRLLTYLFRRRKQICSRDEIVEGVYGSETQVSPEMIASLVYRLRRRLQSAGFSEDIIQSVRGRGYFLNITE